MKALITGGTGLLGRELLANLTDAVVLSRDPARTTHTLGSARAVRWDPATEPAPLEALQEVEAVFNLAGEPVAEGRWTEDKKRRIRDSRVVGTRNLVAGLRGLDRKPEVLVSASAVGYYGDRGDEELDEKSQAGRGFVAEVCTEWEREALAAEALGVRLGRPVLGGADGPDPRTPARRHAGGGRRGVSASLCRGRLRAARGADPAARHHAAARPRLSRVRRESAPAHRPLCGRRP